MVWRLVWRCTAPGRPPIHPVMRRRIAGGAFGGPFLFSATLVLAGMHASAQTGTSADDLNRRAAERLRALHEEADRLVEEERGVLGQLRKLEIGRALATEEAKQAEAA